MKLMLVRVLPLLILVLIVSACSLGSKGNAITLLFEELKVNNALINSATHLIVVPQTVCNSCIEPVKKIMQNSKDTIFIINCNSPKEFYLLMGKKLNEIPNAYIDNMGLVLRHEIARSFPVVYHLDKGKVVSSHLLADSNNTIDEKTLTQIRISPGKMDLGDFDFNEVKQMTFILKNIGHAPFLIRKVEKSCECLDVEYEEREIKAGDTLHMKVIFKADTIGLFARDIYVYGNISDSPQEIIIEGNAKKN